MSVLTLKRFELGYFTKNGGTKKILKKNQFSFNKLNTAFLAIFSRHRDQPTPSGPDRPQPATTGIDRFRPAPNLLEPVRV